MNYLKQSTTCILKDASVHEYDVCIAAGKKENWLKAFKFIGAGKIYKINNVRNYFAEKFDFYVR